ncbi:22907_t:CDS:2, partial [Racocetra persica]
MEYIEDVDGDTISNDSLLISKTEKEKHKSAKCKYCPALWTRGRAQDMRTHLTMKCKDAYFDTKEAIDKDKETRVNKSLIKWIVCSGILFSAFDSPYFEDFTKMLNPGYNSPKRTILAISILDVEAANILLKVEKKLSKAKNITLCIDGWSSPLKQKVLKNVGPEKFIAIISDAESSIVAAKCQVTTKYPHILSIRCIAHHIQLISSMLEIWKQLGGGRTSADLLKTQMSLYKNQEPPFNDRFISSINIITNWWTLVDLTKNEDHIKTLALQIHSIPPITLLVSESL